MDQSTLPDALKQRYDQLPAPQCTNVTYIYTFLIKLALFTNDAEIRDIICHLHKAVSHLQNIHVSIIIKATYTYYSHKFYSYRLI